MITEKTINEIKARIVIADVIGEHIKLKKEGADFVGLCPFHNEKTPSFKVSPSKSIFKCFGCGKSGDAINFLMEHCKLSYLDAMKQLAEKYKVPVDEISFQKKEYQKPAAKLEKLSKPLISWFEEKRHISNNTLLRFNITEAREWMPKAQNEVPAICFNYYRNEELINIKFRANNKDFKMAKDAELIFYNLDSIKDVESCVIVEGEIDCMSMYEASVYDCVSVPNGAATGNQKLEYLDNCYEWFVSKKRVIIATDNDAPGISLREELARRIGYEKCFTVEYPAGCKDANDVLVRHGKETLQQCIENAKEWPVAGILTVEILADEVIHYYKHGYPNGYAVNLPGIGPKNMQLMLGQWTAVTGIPGSGKSEFIDWMMMQMSKDHGWVWAIVSPENQPSSLHISKLVQKYTVKSFDKRENPAFRVTPNELAVALDFIHHHFLFINVNEVDMSLNGLLDKVEELVVRKGVKGFELDPWNKIRHEGKIDVDYLRNALNNVSYRCKRSGVHGMIIAHPTKMEREKINKAERYKVPTLYSISGGADWYNQADNGITIYRDFITEVVTAYRQKIRYDWLGQVGWSSYKYNRLTNNYEYLDSSEKKESSSWVPLPANYAEPSVSADEGAGDDLPF